MKRTLFALILLGLALAMTSLHLVQQLRQEQAAVASLQSQLAELRNASRSGPLPPSDIEPTGGETTAPREPSALAPADTVTTAFAPIGDEGVVVNPELPGARFRQSEMLRDPQYRDALRQRTLLTLPRTMPGLREALGLSEAQATQLFELLADQQVQSEAIDSPLPQRGQSREEFFQQRREQRLQQDEQAQAQIRELLGDQGYQRWREYRASLGARHQVEHMRTTLARHGVVMDEQLMPVLVQALADDQASWAAQQQAALSSRPAPSQSPSQAMVDGMGRAGVEQRLQSQSDQLERSLQAVSPYLTGEQRRVLQEDQQAGMALLESQMNLMRLQRELAGQRAGD